MRASRVSAAPSTFAPLAAGNRGPSRPWPAWSFRPSRPRWRARVGSPGEDIEPPVFERVSSAARPLVGERKHTGLAFAPASPRSTPADSRAVATTRGAPLLSPIPHRESRVFRSGLHLYANREFQAPCHGGAPENAASACGGEGHTVTSSRSSRYEAVRASSRLCPSGCVRRPPQSRSGLTLSAGSRRGRSSCGR
jgi:hypothetical protein